MKHIKYSSLLPMILLAACGGGGGGNSASGLGLNTPSLTPSAELADAIEDEINSRDTTSVTDDGLDLGRLSANNASYFTATYQLVEQFADIDNIIDSINITRDTLAYEDIIGSGTETESCDSGNLSVSYSNINGYGSGSITSKFNQCEVDEGTFLNGTLSLSSTSPNDAKTATDLNISDADCTMRLRSDGMVTYDGNLASTTIDQNVSVSGVNCEPIQYQLSNFKSQMSESTGELNVSMDAFCFEGVCLGMRADILVNSYGTTSVDAVLFAAGKEVVATVKQESGGETILSFVGSDKTLVWSQFEGFVPQN